MCDIGSGSVTYLHSEQGGWNSLGVVGEMKYDPKFSICTSSVIYKVKRILATPFQMKLQSRYRAIIM